MTQGVREFDGITVEPYKNPPIVRDAKHPDFFRAIVLLDETAMPGLEYRDGWRNYVYHHGPTPHVPRPRRRR